MRVRLPIQQFDLRVETRTVENVVIQMVLALYYYDLPDKSDGAADKLDDAGAPIAAMVLGAVDACVSGIKLDDVIEKRPRSPTS